LHWIVTGDEKWIYFQNPKRPTIFFKIKSLRTEDDAVRLVVSRGHHLLRAVKTCETVNAHRSHQQLIKLHRALREKRPHYRGKDMTS